LLIGSDIFYHIIYCGMAYWRGRIFGKKIFLKEEEEEEEEGEV